MAHNPLSDFVEATTAKFGIPGVAVGVWADGRETYACHGVTSIDNPLPVDPDTLYVLGSVTKTFTATTLMRLVAEGRVELDAPVRRYVPELRLADERAVASLLFEPLGLSHSFFARDDIMTRRFAVGHNRGEDGTLSIARLWRRWRGENPGGGLASSAADQLRWARFHLGDGRAESGVRVLPAEVLHRMKQPTE